MRTGELGHWWRSLGGPPPPRPALPGPRSADVAIVGAGYTGLWTAYYLKCAQPSLEIVVLEREHAGFGASGRTMFDTVEEIAAVIAEHRIDADYVKGGRLAVALNEAQLQRLREEIANARTHGLDERDLRELTAAELQGQLRVAGAAGASFSPHVARMHPAKLLTGLAATVEGLGVRIYESTPVSAIRPHAALTPRGRVDARWVVRATEGYTAALPGLRRALAPINSSMIVTEPLAPAVWEQIGWDGGEVLADEAHVYVYLQRTADGRIADRVEQRTQRPSRLGRLVDAASGRE